MARKEIDIGIVGNDGTGDSIREAFRKVNDNFKEMYAVFGQGGSIKLQDLGNVITEQRQIFPLTTATGLMRGIVTPADGSTSFNISITASDAASDQLTTANTIPLKINDKITFDAALPGSSGLFGGVTLNTAYYINSILTTTSFTISLTQDGLGINRILTSDSTGQNVKPRIMAGGTGISIDSATDPDRIIVSNTGGRLITDTKPSLLSPLNANGKIIANIGTPTASNVQTFNNLFGNDGVYITTNDVVINKGYADKNYIRKTGGGGSGQIRARNEPLNKNAYTITIVEYINGNAIVPNHGLDSSIDASAYTYLSTTTNAANLKSIIFTTDSEFILNRSYKIVELGDTDFTTLGAQRNIVGEVFVSNTSTGIGTGRVNPVYFIRYVDGNTFSLHFTADDATNNANRILLSNSDGTAVETLTDAYLDNSLLGNWISNEVLPRNSVVRRQGDVMTGPLTLFDHPEPFEGIGTPNGASDLQAATKYYVDNSSFVSRVNLFVSTSGQDVQPNTPPGKEGSSWAYSYATIGKACQKAEYLLAIADVETGPYRQLIAYNNGASLSVVKEYTPGNIAIIKFSNNNGARVDQGVLGNEDITPGKLLVGRLSGAKATISQYLGDDGTGAGQDVIELINVRGTFILGENLEFGDTVKNLHVTIHVESGIYEEDYPIKLPANTAIVGDEFRRVLVRPRDRISQSPWADTWFFRNTTFDGLDLVNTANPVNKKHFVDIELEGWYSHHYYKKPGLPLNPGPKYTNIGGYTTAAQLIANNKLTIQQDIVVYINGLLTSQTPQQPVLTQIEETKSIRDTGFIIDAIVADLIEGGNEKIVNLQEVFSQVTTLNTECKQGIQHISTYINGSVWFASRPTIEKNLITSMINRLYFGFDPAYNTPKNNKDMDVFLCNDATIVRQITCQGHGGFMMVLDPSGQILTKSPYCQQSGSFSGSINQHAFRGGQYIDGFAGNLKPTVLGKLSDYRLRITDIPREPEIPSSFYINGERFKVNAWLPSASAKINAGNLMTLNKNFVKAQSKTYLDTFNVKYDDSEFEQYINLIIDSLIFDMINVGNLKTSLAARRFFRLDELTLRVLLNQKPLLVGVINYIKDTFTSVIANTAVTTNQNKYSQIIDLSITAETGTAALLQDLCSNLSNVVLNGIESADNLDYPEFILKLEPTALFASINPATITLITPGNTSMLSNDFTQVNDLGYGIVTNNKGLAECVSVFSYYTWTSMFSANGGQIRSLNSSSANGEYGLVALGSDPLEVSDSVTLADNLIQVAKVNKTGPYANDGDIGELQFYIESFQYIPYNVSVIEVNHGGSVGIVRYEMSNITVAATNGSGDPTILKVNLNTSGNNDSSTSGLKAALVHEQNIIIRSGQNLRFSNVLETNPVRPSTALTFEGDPDLANAPVYRVIAYNTTGPTGAPLNALGQPQDKAILTTDTTYNYIILTVDKNRIALPDPSDPLRTLGSQAGDIKIAVNPKAAVVELARINTGQMITAWDGKLHRVVSYTDESDLVGNYGIITLDELATPVNINSVPQAVGIQSPVVNALPDGVITLRCGLAAGEVANIRVRISTLRATGHDFLDVGTGGYNSSNYPSKIFGAPRPPSQAKEVEERSSGRVFYVSTDQNGFFRVGRFFTVDQGTGTVKFAASIALSNLDGLGFKKGTEISEFSDDDKFTDLANDAVPTEFATDSYISYRLGLTRNNNIVPVNQRIGPGFLPLNGVAGPIANISWNGYKITSLGSPTNSTDATNKDYVDNLAITFDSLSKKVDVISLTAEKGDVLVSFGNVRGSSTIKGFSHAKISGDIETTLTSSATSTLASAIHPTNSITSIALVDASAFPGSGYVLVQTANNEEVFFYTNKSGNNLDPVLRLSLENSIDSKFNAGFPSAHAIGTTVISLNKLELNNQIKALSIIDGDISTTAGILQSKLSMNEANTFPSADWARTDKAQADLGLAKFDATEFETDRGFVRLNSGGIAHSRISAVNTRSVLGNNSPSAASSPSSIPFHTVFQKGFRDSLTLENVTPGRRYVWSSLQLALEANSTQSAVEITTNAEAGSIVLRNGDGRTQLNGIETDGAISVLTFSGTDDTATPVEYKGQWTPGTNASLHATSADYLTNVDTTVVRTNNSQIITGIKQFSGGIAASNNTYNFGTGTATGSLYFTPATDTYGLTKNGGGDVITFQPSGITIDGVSTLPKAINASDKFLRSDGTWAIVGTLSSGTILNTREITTGDAATTGTVTGDWTLTAGSKWQATYADLAEYYTADKNYEPGTVLVFGGAAETTTTTVFGDSRVAGVVTTDPAYVMNAGLKDKPNNVCIALQGRVPCKVVGKVSKGDLLTTSANPGYAIRATNPTVGTIIGKALENKDSFELGVIEIAVGRM
jgi:hypothetical protein